MDRSKWEYKKLGEVCEILDKLRKPVTKSDRVAGQYPYYGATGIQDYVANYIFDGRYLLLGEDGAKWGANDRSAFIIEGKTWVNNHAHILKINSDYMDVFVMYYLNHKDLSEYITGAVVPKLTQAAMAKIPVPYINIADQQRIVAELNCLNEMIALKQEQLKEFDKLAQSIFYDMFGGDTYSKQELASLYEFIDYRGKTPNKIKAGIPLITARNIRFGYLDYSVQEYISEDEFETRQSRGIAKKGDLLFTTEAPMGFAAIADLDVFSTGQRVITFQLKNGVHINNLYMLYYLMSEEFQQILLNNATGVTVKGIKAAKLKRIKVSIPPLALQQQFAEKIQAIEAQKELVKKSIAETQQLLDSRMDYYFD